MGWRVVLTYKLINCPGREERIILEVVGICCRILETETIIIYEQTGTQTDKLAHLFSESSSDEALTLPTVEDRASSTASLLLFNDKGHISLA